MSFDGQKDLKDYFNDIVESPDPTKIMMASGILQCYISSTFLNGWINYVDPVKAYVLPYYQDREDSLEQIEKWENDEVSGKFHPSGGSMNTDLGKIGDDILLLAQEDHLSESTKEYIPANTITNTCHDPSQVGFTNQLINYQSYDEDDRPQVMQHWWFFWFDRDVSDCCIGRFEKEDGDREEVIEAFDNYVEDRAQSTANHREQGYQDPIEIDTNLINGWVKF